MNAKLTGNRAASVRQRLLNLAKARGDEFQRVLVRYALERLLYRLSVSEHKDRFLLKGALLFAVWSPGMHRPTKDLVCLGVETHRVWRWKRLSGARFFMRRLLLCRQSSRCWSGFLCH